MTSGPNLSGCELEHAIRDCGLSLFMINVVPGEGSASNETLFTFADETFKLYDADVRYEEDGDIKTIGGCALSCNFCEETIRIDIEDGDIAYELGMKCPAAQFS